MVSDYQVDAATVSHIVTSLKRCRDFEFGTKLHHKTVRNDLDINKYVAAALIKMYSKCRRKAKAQQVFDRTHEPDVVLWTTLILAYVENGEHLQAMELYAAMSCEPDSLTFVALLRALSGLETGEESKSFLQESSIIDKVIKLHELITRRGFTSDVLLTNTLLQVYCKYHCIHQARKAFLEMKHQNVASWTTIILGHAANGESLPAMDILSEMDCEPDSFTYLAAFKACGALASDSKFQREFCLEKGIEFHSQLKETELHPNMLVATTLLDMYGKCGSMIHARQVFNSMTRRDVITWTSLLLGHVENGETTRALELFPCMDCPPNSLTYVPMLKACIANLDSLDRTFLLEKATVLHKQIKDNGYESDVIVSTTLVDVYGKLGSLLHAKEVFDGMPHKDVVAWTSLVQSYTDNGDHLAALNLFTSMDCQPNTFTCVSSLKACGSLVALLAGRNIHGRVARLGLEQDPVVATALVEFYGKCGSMRRAEECFNAMQYVDLVAWSTFISGFSSGGDSLRVIRLVTSMEEAGFEMEGSTRSCVLAAYSHAGLVEEARLYFQTMLRRGDGESVKHYNCVADALCRANKAEQAVALVNSMPVEASSVTWKTLRRVGNFNYNTRSKYVGEDVLTL